MIKTVKQSFPRSQAPAWERAELGAVQLKMCQLLLARSLVSYSMKYCEKVAGYFCHEKENERSEPRSGCVKSQGNSFGFVIIFQLSLR